MKTRQKVTLGFIGIALLVVIAGYISLAAFRRNQQQHIKRYFTTGKPDAAIGNILTQF